MLIVAVPELKCCRVTLPGKEEVIRYEGLGSLGWPVHLSNPVTSTSKFVFVVQAVALETGFFFVAGIVTSLTKVSPLVE